MRSSREAAGFDIYANKVSIIQPETTVKISTGIILQIPKGYYVKLYDRSSMVMNQIFLQAGLIDSDYLGELIVVLSNNRNEPFIIEKHMKIAQFIVHKLTDVEMCQCTEFEKETMRGTKGFGSTSFF